MKTFGISMLLLGSMALSASAEVAVQELLVRRKGADVNIRVVINNPAKTPQAGPIQIELYVRDNDTLPWDKVQTWNDIKQGIKPGNKIARDFFEENNAKLRKLAEDGAFEVKAVIKLPNGATDVVSNYSWHDKE